MSGVPSAVKIIFSILFLNIFKEVFILTFPKFSVLLGLLHL
jgi:hypothetical protein